MLSLFHPDSKHFNVHLSNLEFCTILTVKSLGTTPVDDKIRAWKIVGVEESKALVVLRIGDKECE